MRLIQGKFQKTYFAKLCLENKIEQRFTMVIYRLKSKNIIYDLYLPQRSNGKVILYVPGLPGHPRKRNLGETFASRGFTFFEMRFPGSWESDGVFTMDACVESLEEACSFIRGGSAIELRMGSTKKWAYNQVVLMGSSFGGGVVLSSQIQDPLTFVLLAPVTSLTHLKSSLVLLPSGDDDLFHLLLSGYSNVYRGLTKKDWENFLSGKTLVNPEANIKNLENKKLIFVQGSEDEVIRSNHTNEFVRILQNQGLQVKILTVAEAGHGSDLEDKTVDVILNELKNI